MRQTALITYHSAYNIGSVLQAFATQTTLNRLGYPAEIIDYRMAEQDYYYQRLYRLKYGLQIAIKDLMMIPVQGKRKARARAYENFFAENFQRTRRVSEPSEVAEIWKQYDTVISGSDQIWNKHSLELEYNDWKHMEPYILKGFQGHKISYASSIGNMEDNELERILPEICTFDAVSAREGSSADKLERMLGRPVTTVLDPTFLLNRDEWIKELRLQPREDGGAGILCYSLAGPTVVLKLMKVLAPIAKRRHCKVKVVAPFAWIPCVYRDFEQHPEYGPREFLQALCDAELIVTNSYHGTVLSLNFGKEFYSICRREGRAEFRKTDILNRLGLADRVVYDVTEIPTLNLPPIDYDAVYDKLEAFRRISMDYLVNSLGRTVPEGN